METFETSSMEIFEAAVFFLCCFFFFLTHLHMLRTLRFKCLGCCNCDFLQYYLLSEILWEVFSFS